MILSEHIKLHKLGMMMSDETKKRMSIASKGNTHAKGSVRSETFKRNLSKRMTGLPSKKKKQIIVIGVDGKIINEYESITLAAQKENVLISSIANNLSGRSKKCNGLIFKYK